jgi:hypothetical protein
MHCPVGFPAVSSDGRWWYYTAYSLTSIFLFPPAPHSHPHPRPAETYSEKLLFVLVGWLGSFVLRQLLFRAGAQSLSAMLLSNETYSSKPNELKCMSLEAGSEVSVFRHFLQVLSYLSSTSTLFRLGSFGVASV